MTTVYCDICDRRFDTDDDTDYAHDAEVGVYSCGRCQKKWNRSFQDVHACGPEDISEFDC